MTFPNKPILAFWKFIFLHILSIQLNKFMQWSVSDFSSFETFWFVYLLFFRKLILFIKINVEMRQGLFLLLWKWHFDWLTGGDLSFFSRCGQPIIHDAQLHAKKRTLHEDYCTRFLGTMWHFECANFVYCDATPGTQLCDNMSHRLIVSVAGRCPPIIRMHVITTRVAACYVEYLKSCNYSLLWRYISWSETAANHEKLGFFSVTVILEILVS